MSKFKVGDRVIPLIHEAGLETWRSTQIKRQPYLFITRIDSNSKFCRCSPNQNVDSDYDLIHESSMIPYEDPEEKSPVYYTLPALEKEDKKTLDK